MVRTFPYDTAEFLDDDEGIRALAEVALEESDPQMFRSVLGSIARALGYTLLAEAAGLPRTVLIKALRDPDSDVEGALRQALVAASLRNDQAAAE